MPRMQQPLANRNILLGVTGGIAAYKSAVLVRRLVQAGADVQVVMTDSARRFITPLTLQALSGHPVRSSLWDERAELGMGHIELARWADLVLMAPATADALAGLVHGRANDLLTTLCLATAAPLMVAPAMNRIMWADAATQANCSTLEERGVRIIGPDEGRLAERESGPGRMLEPDTIRDHVIAHFGGGALQGARVLVTAGPTREPLDPVRFLSNRSSGRMGYAVATAAAAAGADTTLVSGPTALATPCAVQRVDVQTAQHMHDAVMDRAGHTDIFISVAAVVDYRPAQRAGQKIKKSGGDMQLALVRTPDILATVSARHPHVFAVGFAAETHRLEEHARAKLEKKQLDMLAANLVGENQTFGADDNALFVCWADGHRQLERASKAVLARQLIELIATRYREALHSDG